MGVEAAGPGKESVPVQTEEGMWPNWLGSRSRNTGARTPTYAGVFSWMKEDSGIMGGRQGSSPRASTCFCKSLLLSEPHLPNLYNGGNLVAQSGCEE